MVLASVWILTENIEAYYYKRMLDGSHNISLRLSMNNLILKLI